MNPTPPLAMRLVPVLLLAVFLPVVGLLQACGPGAGAGADRLAEYDLGAARSTLADAVEAVGGLDALTRGGDQVEARALVTVLPPEGPKYPSIQRHRIDLPAGRLRASGVLAEGAWEARVSAKGQGSVDGEGFAIAPADRSRILDALTTTAHRLRGPLNLLGGSERAAPPETVQVGGESYNRVRVENEDLAYYFRPGGELAFVTAGADEAGGDGTVTLYSYTELDNGLRFPSRLRVVQIGRNVLIGPTAVMTVEYSEIKAH